MDICNFVQENLCKNGFSDSRRISDPGSSVQLKVEGKVVYLHYELFPVAFKQLYPVFFLFEASGLLSCYIRSISEIVNMLCHESQDVPLRNPIDISLWNLFFNVEQKGETITHHLASSYPGAFAP